MTILYTGQSTKTLTKGKKYKVYCVCQGGFSDNWGINYMVKNNDNEWEDVDAREAELIDDLQEYY